jgi:hypothetical protein
MPQRTFQVDAEPLPDGFWPGQPLDVQSRPELEALLLDAAAVLDRVGGTFSIVALRQELADSDGRPSGLFVSVAFRGKWESYAPAQRAVQVVPQPPPEPRPEPEPPEEEQPPPLAAAGDDAYIAAESDDDFGPDAEQALAAAED